jgi:eukaryotic-like serine/threonine-protein kinase
VPGHFNIETVLRPGQIVAAQYRVDRLIAKGGMAALWAGTSEHTGKRVALKVILHSFAANDEVIELFRREALSASKVNHPNVVNIFDVIDHEGMTCIVMELLDGETLGSYLARNGALSLEKTLALLLPAMHGVAAANAQGVVHRDLKPGNIFLCCSSDGRLITTKVLDFGISVMMGRVGDAAPATDLFTMFGTPAYMAPEAIEFSPTIDGRADVYGFGVLLFEMLTGKLPFIGPPGLDLLRRILTEDAPMVTLYRSDLSSDVVNLIACALAKDPNDRFPDMAHLVQATEDRLLPLLPTPSCPAPISDILPLAPSEWNASAPIPVVGTLFEKEPLRRANHSGTRALYSVAGDVLRGTNQAGLASGRKLSLTSAGARARRQRVSARRSRRLLHHRGSIGVAIIILVIGVAWVSIPSSSNGRDTPERAATVPRPIATPPPSRPTVSAPSPTVAAETLDAVTIATAPSPRMAAPHPSRHGFRGRSMTRKPRASQEPPPAPRSGRLTPSDF